MAGILPLNKAKPPTDSEENKKLQKLKEEFAEAETARQPYEGIWLLNIAFMEGEQWLTWDGNRLARPRLSKNRILVTDNRIQPAVRTEVAKMTKSRPAWDATPDSTEDAAVDGARFGERVLDNKWDALKMQAKRKRALEWSRVCAAGFWKVTWDSSLGVGRDIIVGPDGKVVRNPEDNAPLDPAALEAIPEEVRARVGQMKRVHQGDVRIDVRSPFQVYPDPLAEGMDECERFWEKSIVSPVYVKGRWHVDIPADSEAQGGLVQMRLSKQDRAAKKTGVVIYEYWEKGNAVNPNGRHVVWAGDRILEDGPNPYQDDEGKSILPYVMFPGITVPGRFWPTSIVEQLRPIQVELNKAKSQVAENRNRFGNPSLLVSRQATVKYHGVPGERVEYDDTTQNAIPSFMQPPEMPAYTQNEIEGMKESIMSISGQHETSHGQVPAGVTAAAAINLLQEQDDTRLGPSIEDCDTALTDAGQMVLRLIGTYYQEERLLTISGEDGKFDAMKFKGEMLKGQFRIKVKEGSTLPKSKAAKQSAMSEMFALLIQYGVRFDQRALRKFFVSYDAGGLEQLLGDLDVDEKKVNRENRQMYLGEDVMVDTMVDNHEAEIAGHREEMKSVEFSKQDDAIKAKFYAHLQGHLDAQEAQIQAEVAKQLTPPPGVAVSPEMSEGDLESQLASAGVGTVPSP